MSWVIGEPVPEAFKRLPHQIYQDDPLWIPEDPAALDWLFSEEHGYFAEGRATLLVREGAARVAGFFDPRLRMEGEPAAFFGFWETVNGLEPNRELFQRVEAWAAGQGARRLYGPVNFTTHRDYRLRLGGFDEPPFPGEPYHPAWYPQILHELGFAVAAEYTSHATTKGYRALIGELLRSKAHYLSRPPNGVRIEALTGGLWMERLDELYGFVDEAFSHNVAYLPLSERDFRRSYGEGVARRLCPRTSVIGLDARGRVAGFLICFPDYGPLLRQGNPARVSASDLRFERHFPELARPCFLAKTAAVRGDLRNGGLMSALSAEAAQRSLDVYQDGMICLMHRDNYSTRFTSHVSDRDRRYALFGKGI
ncbi:MAG: hypothetical protein ABJF88_05305 [Rhodothermales bacterium]